MTDHVSIEEFRRLAGRARARPRQAPGRMNRTEAAYAEQLRLLQIAGDVVAWAYQPVKVRLGPACYYTPDFVVVTAALEMVAVEIKGHREDDAMAKFSMAAEKYPYLHWRMVARARGAWRTIKEY